MRIESKSHPITEKSHQQRSDSKSYHLPNVTLINQILGGEFILEVNSCEGFYEDFQLVINNRYNVDVVANQIINKIFNNRFKIEQVMLIFDPSKCPWSYDWPNRKHLRSSIIINKPYVGDFLLKLDSLKPERDSCVKKIYELKNIFQNRLNPFVHPHHRGSDAICRFLTGSGSEIGFYRTYEGQLQELKIMLREGRGDPDGRMDGKSVLWYIIFSFNSRRRTEKGMKYMRLFLQELVHYAEYACRPDSFFTPLDISGGVTPLSAFEMLYLYDDRESLSIIAEFVDRKQSFPAKILNINIVQKLKEKEIVTNIDLQINKKSKKTNQEQKKEDKERVKTRLKKGKYLNNEESKELFQLHKNFFGTDFKEFESDLKENCCRKHKKGVNPCPRNCGI